MRERFRKLAARFAAPILAVTLATVWMLPGTVFNAKQVIPASMNTLDDSWHLELPWRLSRGEFSGRDLIFTYGPLFQLVHGGPALLFGGGAPESLVRWEYVGPAIACALLLWWLLAATGAPAGWRAAGVVLWPLLFPVAIKPVFALAVLAWIGRGLAAPLTKGSRPDRAVLALAAAGAPLTLLYAFDMGLMTFLATLALCGGAAAGATLTKGEHAIALRRNTAWTAGAAAAGFAAFALVTVLVGFSRYLPDSWAVATGYSGKMAIAATEAILWRLGRGFATGIVILGACSFLAWREWKQSRAIQAPLAAVAAVAVLASAWTRYGLTRGDESHLQVALDPVKTLALLLVPLAVRTLYGWRAGATAALIATIAAFWVSDRSPGTAWSTARYGFYRIQHLQRAPAEIDVQHPGIAQAAAAARELPGDAVFVWPWASAVNVLSGKANPAWTMQSYVAHTDALEESTVARLGTSPVVVFGEVQLDGIANQTRTPVIFRHLLDHYELSGSPDPSTPSFRVLRHREAARFREVPLLASPVSFKPDDRKGVSVPLRNADVRANDLLWMRMTADRTKMRGLWKPGKLVVTLGLEGNRGAAIAALLPQDGQPHPQLVSLVHAKDPLFFAPFTPAKEWRATEKVVGLNFRWMPIDALTKAPSRITVESISVLRRVDAEPVEMSLTTPDPVARALILGSGLTPSATTRAD